MNPLNRNQRRAEVVLGTACLGLLMVIPLILGGADTPRARPQDAQLAATGLDQPFYSLPTDAQVGADLRWSFPRLAAAQLDVGESLTFALPGGRAVSIPLIERQLLGSQTISFTFSSPQQGASAEIVLHRTMLAGTVRATINGRPEVWSLKSAADGDRYTRVTDDHPCGGVVHPENPNPQEGGVADICPDTGYVIDVLLAYTPAFRSRYPSPVEAEAALAADLAAANTALANSRLVTRFRVAGFFELTGNGSGLKQQDLQFALDPADGVWDNVHLERDIKRADIVSIFTTSNDGGISAVGVDNPEFAFNVCGNVGGLLLAHELGHNLGCCHAVGDGGGCATGGYYPFSNGYRFFSGGVQYRTVMAYEPGAQVPYFSNPDVQYLGQATGSPGENPTNSASNARTIGLLAFTVSQHRCSTELISDCDDDGIADADAVASGIVADCNATGIPDLCDIALGISLDLDSDLVPDECPLAEDVTIVGAPVTPLDTYGTSVSMDATPNDLRPFLLVGAPGSDVGASNAGAAYLFQVVAGLPKQVGVIRPGDPRENSFFGRGVSVFKRTARAAAPTYPERNFALIGAFRWTDVSTVGTFPSKGKIYLYSIKPNSSRELWRYTPPTTGANSVGVNGLFGYAVAMGRHPQDGADQIVVGAPGYNNGTGRVYFLRNYFAGTPAREQPGFLGIRSAPVPQEGDLFGAAVALEPAVRITTSSGVVTDRMLCVIGAPGRNDGRGAAYVFDRSYISTPNSIGSFPSAGVTLLPPNTIPLLPGDKYGTSVAVSGNLIAIGAPGASGGRGIVHFFERSTTTATAGPSSYAYRGFFKAPNGEPNDALGSSIAIAPDRLVTGRFTVVVGAPKADVGTPTGLRVDGGRVYVLQRTIGESGAALSNMRTATDVVTGDEFGYSASSIPGGYTIGIPFSDISGLNSGKGQFSTAP